MVQSKYILDRAFGHWLVMEERSIFRLDKWAFDNALLNLAIEEIGLVGKYKRVSDY